MNEAPVEPTRQNLPALDPSAGMDPQGTGEQNDFPPEQSVDYQPKVDGQNLQGNDPNVIGSETLETDA